MDHRGLRVSAPADVAVETYSRPETLRRQNGPSGIPRWWCLYDAFFLSNFVLDSDDLVRQINALERPVLLSHVQIADDLLDEQADFREETHTLLRVAHLLDEGIGHDRGGVPAIGTGMNVAQA